MARTVMAADRSRQTRSSRRKMLRSALALALVLAAAGIAYSTAQSPGSEAGPATPAPEAESRTWTDTSEKFHVEATFRGLEDGKARLEKSDGGIIGIALEKLCEADQEYVRMQASPEPAQQAPAGDEGGVEAADMDTVPEPGEAAVAADDMGVGQEPSPGDGGLPPEGESAEEGPPESSPAESVSPDRSDAEPVESAAAAQPAQDVEQTDTDSSSSLPRLGMIGIAVAGGVLLLGIGWWIWAKRRSGRSRPAKSESIATPAPVARSSATPPSPAAPSGLVQRARSALSYGQLDEKRLASDDSYRTSKVNEFSEIIEVAKDACREAGRTECLSALDQIMVLGTILYLAWGELRPKLEAVPMGLFAYSVMVIGCWTSPQSAIRQFALHEAKPGDTEEATAKLVTTTASSLKQLMAKLGLG
ncbi:MAG TPA: SHD1 domain-containing protein [Thermoguttaceae bacterium]|nr:SHD1 domain-containing protein [Thermoguttaceae bacterium]